MSVQDSNNVDCFLGSQITTSNGQDAMSQATGTPWQYITVGRGISGNAAGAYAVAPADVASNGIQVTMASGLAGAGDPRLGGWIAVPLIIDGTHLGQTGSTALPAMIQFQIERVTDPTVNNSLVEVLCGFSATSTLTASTNYISAGYAWLGLAGANPSSYYQYRLGGANTSAVGGATNSTRGGMSTDILNGALIARTDAYYINTGGAYNSQILINIIGNFSVTTPLYAFIGFTSVTGAIPANTQLTVKARYRGVIFPEAQ
jgi:hypothetical protein